MKKLNLIITLSLLPFTLHAQDVYNFYFQKAPGPTTVIQGGAKTDAEKGQIIKTDPSAEGIADGVSDEKAKPSIEAPPKASEAVVVAAPAPGKTPMDKEGYKFSFTMGAGQFTDDTLGVNSQYRGLALGIGYHLNKYFAFSFDGIVGNYVQKADDKSKDNQFRPSIGMTMTPFRLNTFGWELFEFQGLLGITTAKISPRRDWALNADPNYYYMSEPELTTRSYWGLGVGIVLPRDFVIQTQFKRLLAEGVAPNYDQLSVALNMRF